MGASTKLSTPFLQIAVCGLERLGSKQLVAAARDSANTTPRCFPKRNFYPKLSIGKIQNALRLDGRIFPTKGEDKNFVLNGKHQSFVYGTVPSGG